MILVSIFICYYVAIQLALISYLTSVKKQKIKYYFFNKYILLIILFIP
jgi:hypothetical protein